MAGVSRDEKAPVEAAVKRAFAGREGEPWSASLVRLGGLWSVTLNGPGGRSLSFTAEEHGLAAAIRLAVGDGQPQPASASVAAAPMPERNVVRERHACGSCGQGILVSYESQPGETKEQAPLACPHCWAVGRIEVGAWAATGGDYQAEKCQ